MNILITILTVFDVLISLLIIALVLVQQSKSGGGLGTTFGGGGSDSLFGAHASSQLSRLTVVFASIFLIVTLALAILAAHRPKEQSASELNSMLSSIAAKQQVAKPVQAVPSSSAVRPKALDNKTPVKTK